MKTEAPTPISIPPDLAADLAARCDGPSQFERFDNMFRAVIAVPKATIDKQEAKWKRSQARKRAKKAS